MENERVYVFSTGLHKNLDEVKGRILSRRPLPTLWEVFSEVRREEGRRKVMLGEPGPPPSESSALVSKNGPFFGQLRPIKKGEKIWCDHCHKPRHTRETCWDLHGKPGNWKPRSSSNFHRESRAFQATGPEEQVHSTNTEVSTEAPSFGKEQLALLYKLFSSTKFSSPPLCSLAQKGTYSQPFCL